MHVPVFAKVSLSLSLYIYNIYIYIYIERERERERYIYIYIYIYMSIHEYLCMCIYIYIYICTHMHTYICTVHMRICLCARVCVCVCGCKPAGTRYRAVESRNRFLARAWFHTAQHRLKLMAIQSPSHSKHRGLSTHCTIIVFQELKLLNNYAFRQLYYVGSSLN